MINEIKIKNERGISWIIQDNLDENIPTERIVLKLGKYYGLSREEAIKRINAEKKTVVV